MHCCFERRIINMFCLRIGEVVPLKELYLNIIIIGILLDGINYCIIDRSSMDLRVQCMTIKYVIGAFFNCDRMEEALHLFTVILRNGLAHDVMAYNILMVKPYKTGLLEELNDLSLSMKIIMP
jgi:hypothetical protein